MIEHKIDPLNLGFWTLAIIYFRSKLAPYQENQFGASQIGKCSKETKFVKYRKFIFLKNIFLYDRAKNRPPKLGFWTLAIIYFRSKLAPYQENQFGASQIGKCSKETKNCKISKIFILKKYFSIWSSEKSTPKTGFLNSCYNLRSIYPCVLPRKSVWSKSNWKVFRGDKICKVSKVFIFKSGFSIWSSKKSTFPTWVFELLL